MIDVLITIAISVACAAGYGLIGTIVGALTLRNQRGDNPVMGKWDDPEFSSASWGMVWPLWIIILVVAFTAIPFVRLYALIGERLSEPKPKNPENVVQPEETATIPTDPEQYVPIMVYKTPKDK